MEYLLALFLHRFVFFVVSKVTEPLSYNCHRDGSAFRFGLVPSGFGDISEGKMVAKINKNKITHRFIRWVRNARVFVYRFRIRCKQHLGVNPLCFLGLVFHYKLLWHGGGEARQRY